MSRGIVVVLVVVLVIARYRRRHSTRDRQRWRCITEKKSSSSISLNGTPRPREPVHDARARITLVAIADAATPVPPASICIGNIGIVRALHHSAPTSDRAIRIPFVAPRSLAHEKKKKCNLVGQANRPITTEDFLEDADCCFESPGRDWSRAEIGTA